MDESKLIRVPGQTLLEESLLSGKAIFDDSMSKWNEIMKQIVEKSSRIIALRGAGAWNGMDKDEIDNLIENYLIPQIDSLRRETSQVTILFDGDYDSPDEPDLGYVAGRLIDHFGNLKAGVVFIAAQKESWHKKDRTGLNLDNANGLQYVTYLFPDNTYSGDHSQFTQNEYLIDSGKYEQWYIGASGEISKSQLIDYNSKSNAPKSSKVKLFRVRNNTTLDAVFEAKYNQAKIDGNEAEANKMKFRINQRLNFYGIHWNNDGTPNVISTDFPNLDLEFIS